MSDLEKLIEAVEGGNLHPLDLLCLDAISHGRAQKAFDGSLDAAKALHEALLPGWSYVLEDDDGNIHAAVWPHGEIGEQSSGSGPTAARAWLLAVLRAYAAQQEPTP